jgi:1-aminocyclopropane-1-carboxylate deaminase/D-cysteine desulfhydrase-like pyridoxal-dependent ACC family enzyme
MRTSLFTLTPINQELEPRALGIENKDLNISVKRLDQIDRILGGNKLFKLQLNIEHALRFGFKGILTFGGAYSNHIAATAAMVKDLQISCIGMIRGERPKELSITLSRAELQGMRLEFVSRDRYRNRYDTTYLNELKSMYPDHWIIPEGGANALGIEGCRHILRETDNEFNHILVAGGTGGTACGLISSCTSNQHVTCIAVLKARDSIEKLIKENTGDYMNNWDVNDAYTFGGYAKTTPELDHFVNDFIKTSGIPIEPVYTGKLFFGLKDLIIKDRFRQDDKILVIHTGGLQYLEY